MYNNGEIPRFTRNDNFTFLEKDGCKMWEVNASHISHPSLALAINACHSERSEESQPLIRIINRNFYIL